MSQPDRFYAYQHQADAPRLLTTELVEALRALVNAHDEDPPMLTETEWQHARAAVRKAEVAGYV